MSADRLNEAATEVMLAEFQFLSGLIPFYRRVEMTVLAGTGLVISGVVAALAALEAAQHPNATAEGILLAVGAWAPTFLLLVENMALTRLRRASLYIAQDLHPLATRLTGQTEVLRWERGPARRLMESVEEFKRAHAGRRAGLASLIVRRKPVEMFASSIPLLGTIACTSLVFASAGVLIDFTILNLVVGGIAGACSIALAAYGIAFTWIQEQRVGESLESTEPGRRRQTLKGETMAAKGKKAGTEKAATSGNPKPKKKTSRRK